MQDNDLNIEDFIKLFLDSFAGKEIKDIKQIADYFERESLKFVKKNSDATFTSKQRDLMLGEFLEKVEYAKKEIDKPFLRHEKMFLDRIYEAESRGINTSNYVVANLPEIKLQMFDIYRPYKGELSYWEVQLVYQGFELFKLQHEMDSYVSTPKPTKQQTGFYLGYSETQLIALHKALIDNNFLDNQTKDVHFINAFNGKELTVDFKPLDWFDYTRGAIFISYFLRNHKNLWSATKHILVIASYKNLLNQSKNNGTFDSVSKELDSIQKKLIY